MSQAGQFYPTGVIATLTGDVGGAISPVAGNIDILGGAGITVTGTPGTLTVSHAGAFSDSFPTDAGTAVPVAGDTNILGGTNINTTGAGNTVTVILDDDVTLAGFLDAGTTITAGTGITSTLGDITAGNGNLSATVGNVFAGNDLEAVDKVTFQSLTDGVLVGDASGEVYASGSLLTPTGFATWTGAGAYFDDTVLGDFEVLRGGTGYIKSVPVTWAGAQTVSGLTAGNTYVIYIDDTGTIGKTTAFTQATFEDYIVLFECLRDSTGTNIQYTVKENHPYDFQASISYYLHETIGTVIENHNQGANITLNGTQKIEIVGADELSDHGLYTDIPDSGGVAETWKQMYTNGAGKWATYQSSDTFNGFWNSAGTPTAPSGNKFVIYTLYVSKDNLNAATPTYWAVLDDAEYNNLASAQLVVAGNSTQVATAELAKLEFAQLGFIIYQQSISTIVDVIIEKSTVRESTSAGAGSNDAALIITDVTNFDGILSATDTTVQVALETIDEWGKTTTDHAVLIGQGTGTPIISLAVAGNGELIIGSAGADPAVGSITSTDGSLTITPGAGTLVIEGTDATEGQDGVVELATDAEAIDGTDAVRAIVPTSLKAKLGTQTDHGILVGSGTTAAITALAVGTNGQVVVGSTGADPVFANITSSGGSIAITEGAGTLNLEVVGGTGAQNTHTISPSGGDYTTIQAALDDNVTANTLFLVYPGTYTGDTISYTANNQSVTGVGNTSSQVVTITNGDNVDFSTLTGCVLERMTVSVTGATGASDTISGSTGSISVEDCIIEMTNASVAAALSPAAVRITGAGAITLTDTAIAYTNNVAAAPIFKSAITIGTGSALILNRVTGIVESSAASLGSNFIESASTGTVDIFDSTIFVTDTTGTDTCGILYDAATLSTIKNNEFQITIGAANTGCAIELTGTATLDSTSNKIDILDVGGTSYSFIIAAGATLTSKFDDITAADGASATGTYTSISSEADGSLTGSSIINATTFDTNVAAAAVTLTGNTLAADGTDANIDINITPKGTGGIVTSSMQTTTANVTDALVMSDTGEITSDSNLGDTYDLSAYDTGLADYVDFIRFTVGDPATCDLIDTVTMNSNIIYYATGTDVAVTDGGTGASTLTDHGVLVGSGTAAVTPLAVGTNGQLLVGSTGADPVFATMASADNSIEFTVGAGAIDISAVGTIPVNNQTGTTYELVPGDAGSIVTCTNAAAITVTIPVNADVTLDIGTNVLISQNGAGTVTLAPEGGVTLSSRGALLDTAGQYAIVSCTKIDTNVWLVGGDLA